MDQGGWGTRTQRRIRVTKVKVTRERREDEDETLDPSTRSWVSRTFHDEDVARAKAVR